MFIGAEKKPIREISDIYSGWMAKEKGPSISQRMEIAASSFLGADGLNFTGNVWNDFLIGEDERGIKHVLKLSDSCVVSHASIEWLSSMVHKALHSVVRNGSSSVFLFSDAAIQGITKQIINLADSVQMSEISPVTFKDQKNLTWRKVPYNPTDMKTPTFDYILSRIKSPKSAHALKLFIGSSFDVNYSPQNYLWMFGPGGDGKGTLLNVLADIYGEAVGPVDNFIDKHWTSGLVGKRIAINPDVACPKVVLSGIFKAVTGGGQVQIRPMREKPYYGKVNTLLFLASNEAPQVRLNVADRRRLILVEFTDQSPKHIDKFEEKVKQETPGFILDCILAWGEHKSKTGGSKITLDVEELDNLAESNSDEYQSIFDLCFYVDESACVNPFEFRRCLEDRDQIFRKRREFSDFIKWGKSKGYFVYKAVKIKGVVAKKYTGIGLK